MAQTVKNLLAMWETQDYVGGTNTLTHVSKEPSYSYTQGACQTPSPTRNLSGRTGIPTIFVSALLSLPTLRAIFRLPGSH